MTDYYAKLPKIVRFVLWPFWVTPLAVGAVIVGLFLLLWREWEEFE